MLVDLNCDMGELESLLEDGTQEQLLSFVTSVNVSCGAHAGNEALIEATIRAAAATGVRVGAHPGYPDPANFGRVEMTMDPDELAAEIVRQLTWFEEVANRCHLEVSHVKPHGALYNVAVGSPTVAEAIARAVSSWRPGTLVMGLAGSRMLEVLSSAGLRTWGEAFADRAYEPDGTLRSRKLPGALITSPAEAANQAVVLAARSDVQSICIHSDTPGAVDLARAVAHVLR